MAAERKCLRSPTPRNTPILADLEDWCRALLTLDAWVFQKWFSYVASVLLDCFRCRTNPTQIFLFFLVFSGQWAPWTANCLLKVVVLLFLSLVMVLLLILGLLGYFLSFAGLDSVLRLLKSFQISILHLVAGGAVVYFLRRLWRWLFLENKSSAQRQTCLLEIGRSLSKQLYAGFKLCLASAWRVDLSVLTQRRTVIQDLLSLWCK